MQEKLTKNQHGTRSILLVFVEVTENFDSILSSSGLASWDCFEIWHWSDLPNFWQSSSCWKLRMYLPRWWWCRTPQKGHHHKHHKQENTTNTTKRTSPQTPQTGEHHKHHRTHEKSNPIWIVVGGFFTDQGRLRAEGAEPVVPTEAPQQRAGRRGPLRKFGKGIGDRWDCTKIWQRHRGPVRLHNQENTTARRVHDSFRWIHVSLRWIHVYFMCIFINVFINFICVHVFINFIFMQGFSCFFLIVTLTLTSPTVDRLLFLASTVCPYRERYWYTDLCENLAKFSCPKQKGLRENTPKGHWESTPRSPTTRATTKKIPKNQKPLTWRYMTKPFFFSSSSQGPRDDFASRNPPSWLGLRTCQGGIPSCIASDCTLFTKEKHLHGPH